MNDEVLSAVIDALCSFDGLEPLDLDRSTLRSFGEILKDHSDQDMRNQAYFSARFLLCEITHEQYVRSTMLEGVAPASDEVFRISRAVDIDGPDAP